MTADMSSAARIAIRCLGFASTRENAEEWARLAALEGAPQDVVDERLAEWEQLHAASVQTIESTAVQP